LKNSIRYRVGGGVCQREGERKLKRMRKAYLFYIYIRFFCRKKKNKKIYTLKGFELRAGSEVRIFGFYNNKQTKKQTNKPTNEKRWLQGPSYFPATPGSRRV